MQSRSVLEVDLSAVRNNVRLLKRLSGPDSFFCPMLKASAYGHGIVPIAKVLRQEGVQQVGVIDTDEAWPLRASVPDMDILVYDSLISKEERLWLIQEDLVLLCGDWESLKSLTQLKKKVRIYLKFDTGFSRLGFKLKDTEKLILFLKQEPQILVEAFGSHLIFGEELANKNSQSYQQLKSFVKLKQLFPKMSSHLLNTAGLISQYVNRESCKWGSRPGIGLYGIKPKVYTKDQKAKKKWDQLSLKPSSCLKSRIVAVTELSKGEGVSYEASWKANKKTRVATVSMGYADGFSRAVHAKRQVLLRGQRRSVIGRVCMDYFMIELQKEDQSVGVGEEVIIFDTQGLLPVEEQSQALNTIPYELLSSLGPRVKRVYKEGN